MTDSLFELASKCPLEKLQILGPKSCSKSLLCKVMLPSYLIQLQMFFYRDEITLDLGCLKHTS